MVQPLNAFDAVSRSHEEYRKQEDVVWCDKLGSTPAFGFTFDPHFSSSASLLDGVSALTNTMIEDGQKVRFTIDRQEQLLLSFSSFTGYNYTVDPFRLSIVFQHRIRMKRRSAAPPLVHMESTPRPYSVLLTEVKQRALNIAPMLPHINTRRLKRVGIMSTTAVKEQELPPGITAVLSYLKDAWNGEVSSFQVQFTIKIRDEEDHWDRCIFTMARNDDENEDDLVTVQLDWQRSFPNGKVSTLRSLEGIADKCEMEANRYFESLGEGGGFNEVVYSRI